MSHTRRSNPGIGSLLTEAKLSLQARVFSADTIRRIATEDLARLAYQSNDRLRQDHLTENLFVAYWAGQRRQFGLSVPDGIMYSLNQQIRQDWDRTPALQVEFNGSFESYSAYLQAASRGRVRPVRSVVTKGA